jgi:hypothetical protein
MTKTEYLLTCLSEECSEIIQSASKALRFGLNEVGPGQTEPNEKRIIGEYLDLVAILELLTEETDFSAHPLLLNIIDKSGSDAIKAKKDKVKKYMEK